MKSIQDQITLLSYNHHSGLCELHQNASLNDDDFRDAALRLSNRYIQLYKQMLSSLSWEDQIYLVTQDSRNKLLFETLDTEQKSAVILLRNPDHSQATVWVDN